MAILVSTQFAVADTVRYCATCLAVYRADFERCPVDGGPLRVSMVDPLVGNTIAEHYVLEALIGEGAMGRVYRAHHRVLVHKRFAIKVLLGDLAAASQMRVRFALEAENASRLEHPNIVGIVDYGCTARGLHYIVMELVEGTSLHTVVKRGPLPAARVIRIVHQLCEALDHAHRRGVIHRDLKPDNILVAGEGAREIVRIADFGLSLSVTADTRVTTTGVVCTPAYAAPEQLHPNAKIDHRADLYALGTTMFEMLSGGILPFSGDLDTSMAHKLGCEAPSILMIAPNVPPALVSIVGRLLQRDPDRRPQSALAAIKALEIALQGPSLALRSVALLPTIESATLRPPRRARRRLTLAGLVVLAAIGGVIGWSFVDREPAAADAPVATPVSITR